MVADGDQATALCKLYVWLRYSASRQLTWQRNYNTQPRILGEAQARLTHAIAQASRHYMLLLCRCQRAVSQACALSTASFICPFRWRH